MTSLRTHIIAVSLCILTLGAQGIASGHGAGSPCPARPAVANDLESGKYSQANAALRQQVSQHPDDAQATLWLARSYLALGKYDQAIKVAERAVKLSPDCTQSHFWLARAYGMKADIARSFLLARKAKQEYQAAIQLDPDNLDARRDLMEFYLQAPWLLGGSKDKARAQLEAIASRNATQGDLARGQYWWDLNKPELAAKEFQKVLDAKPQYADAYFQVADFYEFDRKPAQIEVAVQGASALAPADPRVDYYRAVADVMQGRALDKAEQDLKSYLSKAPERDDFPSHAAAHDWLGRIYELRGKSREAIAQYRHALDLSPDNQTAQDALKRLDTN